MAFLIIILGLLLGGGGAFFVLLGFDIVMTERGAAMTIGGTVALSGGVVTLAIGCALVRLSQILRVLKAPSGLAGTSSSAVETVSVAQPSATLSANAAATALVTGAALAAASSAAPATDAPAPAREDAEAAGPLLPDAPSAASADSDYQMTAPPPPVDDTYRTDDFFAELDDVLAPLPGKSLVKEESQLIDCEPPQLPAIDPMPPTRGLPAPPDFEELLGRALEREPDASPDVFAEADIPPPGSVSAPEAPAFEATDPAESNFMQVPAEPVVLGSYKAGGRSYTMYSDGSVEAVTEAGVERFASLESLRAHLARI